MRHACLGNGRFPDVFGREARGLVVGECLWALDSLMGDGCLMGGR